ncbi:MAG: hypothetical protein JWP17_505 [Solirubrobacterales bacterium]|nr:hypothetical protein [Solirubrobacterales bacterium]
MRRMAVESTSGVVWKRGTDAMIWALLRTHPYCRRTLDGQLSVTPGRRRASLLARTPEAGVGWVGVRDVIPALGAERPAPPIPAQAEPEVRWLDIPGHLSPPG